MSDQSDHSNIWGIPERIAAGAAIAGFAFSVIFLSAYIAAGNYGAAGLQLRAGLETAFVFFWPSAIFLTGTHSFQGGAILFLLSASLNACYYVFVSLTAYVLYDKLEKLSASRRAPDLAPIRTHRSPELIHSARTTRSSF